MAQWLNEDRHPFHFLKHYFHVLDPIEGRQMRHEYRNSNSLRVLLSIGISLLHTVPSIIFGTTYLFASVLHNLRFVIIIIIIIIIKNTSG